MSDTLFLRLSGPMQSWGTGSKLQILRTDRYPSKSGVLGLLLCAMGVGRDDAPSVLGTLTRLEMAVRLDRPGVLDWDYHTAGAGTGLRTAEGKVKLTATTKELETLLSRRQYLLDASFLVALRGEAATVARAAAALREPVWPVFLGRKCCVPSEPILADLGGHPNPAPFPSLKAAMEAAPFFVDEGFEQGSTEELRAVVEHAPGSPPPADAILVYDVPMTLRYPSHSARWIVPMLVHAPRIGGRQTVGATSGRRGVNYASDQWKAIRRERLKADGDLCVFCKSPAEEVHHVTYENVGREKLEDLRSLCRLCHDACTQLEYGHDMRETRIDPADPRQRDIVMVQIGRLLSGRRLARRRAILENTRAATDFLADAPG